MSSPAPSDRTRVRRLPDRGVYDRESIYSILDEGFVCHVGFAVAGQAYVIPTGYGRDGHRLILHGSAASRMVGALAEGIDVCVTVTIVDGFVLARSAFHNSMNYRSVVVLGRARLVTDAAEKLGALRCLTDHIVPGRWDQIRPPNEQELKGTSVLMLPLDEASAKVRTGPPLDDEDDYAIPVWAGVVPLRQVAGEPLPDARIPDGVPAVDPRQFQRVREFATDTPACRRPCVLRRDARGRPW